MSGSSWMVVAGGRSYGMSTQAGTASSCAAAACAQRRCACHHPRSPAAACMCLAAQVAAVTARGCVRRCFMAWLFLARERWYKSQMSSMESQVGVVSQLTSRNSCGLRC